MTIRQAIERFDEAFPNTASTAQKLRWLSSLDRELYETVHLTHADAGAFSDYADDMDEDTQSATELLVPAPFDRLYLHWLESRVDYLNGEITRYNNANAVFTAELSAYRNWYGRTHRPLQTAAHYF